MCKSILIFIFVLFVSLNSTTLGGFSLLHLEIVVGAEILFLYTNIFKETDNKVKIRINRDYNSFNSFLCKIIEITR